MHLITASNHRNQQIVKGELVDFIPKYVKPTYPQIEQYYGVSRWKKSAKRHRVSIAVPRMILQDPLTQEFHVIILGRDTTITGEYIDRDEYTNQMYSELSIPGTVL